MTDALTRRDVRVMGMHPSKRLWGYTTSYHSISVDFTDNTKTVGARSTRRNVPGISLIWFTGLEVVPRGEESNYGIEGIDFWIDLRFLHRPRAVPREEP